MNEKVLKTLEYHKITQNLSDYAGSEPGKKMCLNLRPSTNPDWIENSLAQSDAALKRLIKNDRVSFGANHDVRPILKSIELGHVASAAEILGIAGILTLTDELIKYGVPESEDSEKDELSSIFESLISVPLLEKEIRRCIISEDEIADDASSELSQLRRSRSVYSGRIHTQLTNMVNNTYRTYLMDPVITMRGNRYCIPVKAEYKNQVPGLIHDQSSSGSTFFIEPASVVDLNNKLKEIELKERDEIHKILTGLCGRIASHSSEISNNQKTITLLDFIFAKGKYALKLNATKPIFNDEHRINLRNARHPLLATDKVVPISIRLGDDFDLLIVTGPNTGGKTVSLKTTGLLTLMGQSGLLIPTLDRSELGLFTEVYADIGDEQSIEQSLSTFSSHMTSIVKILSNANENCLCLFDELGAGTDPTEGAGLAIAILNYLHDRGIRTMATTHYSELKVYALQTSFVENACCEFDVDTLSPTYRLLIGIPGKSNAFAISEKLGLPVDIIESAKATISNEEKQFENVISDLEHQRVSIEKERESIESYKKEISELKEKLDAKQEKIDEQRERILKEAREEAKEILKEAKDIADDAIRTYQKSTTIDIKTMEKKRTDIREKIKKHSSSESVSTGSSKSHKTLDIKSATPGKSVHIISMNLDGTITVRPDSKGYVSVQCGIITSKVKVSDLYEIEAPEEKEVKKKVKLNISKSSNISPEINVIGLFVDDAVSRIDKYLDDAYLCHIPKVRIVHGKGTGALRNGIHTYLRTCPYVSSFELAAHGEGDAGVTVVTFK